MAKHTSFLRLVTMISNDGSDAAATVKSQLITGVSRSALDSGDHRAGSPAMAAEHPCTRTAHLHPPHTAAWTCEESYRAPWLQNSAPHQCSCFLPFVSQWHQSLGTTLLFGLSLPGPSPASTPLFPGHKASSATQGHPFLSSQTPIN